MNPVLRFCLASLIALVPALSAAQEWTAPTPEELKMTSIPQVPGGPAVCLFKDQNTDDGDHIFTYYTRIKVLTEQGKEYANVELPYFDGYGSVLSVTGRTIHPDGTIVPLTDKPYDKLIVKSQDYKYKAKVFTLPGVEVGSILEYRYRLELPARYIYDPTWLLQGDLYVRKAHYRWRPTSATLVNDEGRQFNASVAWTPILPPGATVVETPLNTKLLSGGPAPTKQLDLDVHDIPPVVKEDFMPPLQSISYRVLFFYTDVETEKEYWDQEGKRWSKAVDKFIGPSKRVKEFADSLVSPGDSEDRKAHKLYAAVMQMENTDFTRVRDTREDKAEGLKKVASADDILDRKRGSGNRLTELFVALCRAAGLKAYVMDVSDRSQRVFVQAYLSFNQLGEYIAIVKIDGKDVYFDPGQRYCEAAHLAWKHTLAGGLRQTDTGTAVATTPVDRYKFNRVVRIANLKLDDRSEASGTIDVTMIGDDALRWRQEALRGDDTALNEALRTEMEHSLPGGMQVRVTDVKNLADPDKALAIDYAVEGPVGSRTGKRLLVPASLFHANAAPVFTAEHRKTPVDMRYPSYVQESLHYDLPAGLTVESAPTPAKATLKTLALYDASVKPAAGTIVCTRSLILGTPLFYANEYPDLRDFYAKVTNGDQETFVLTHSPGAAAVSSLTGHPPTAQDPKLQTP